MAEYQLVGIVADVNGVNIEIGHRAGEVVIIPPPGIGALFFDATGRDQLAHAWAEAERQAEAYTPAAVSETAP